MIARIAIVLALVGTVDAWADDELDHCDAHNPRPRDHQLGGKLRWDVGAAGLGVADGWKLGAGLLGGVTYLIDWKYVFSVDAGVRATVGSQVTSTKIIDGLFEGELRWYPLKVRQAFGIDECDCGTKTRRWSEAHDYVPYALVLGGYGHMRNVDAGSRDAFLLSTGLGVDLNLAQTSRCPDQDPTAKVGGNRHAIFVQAGWRFDVAGSGSTARLGGPFLEAGVRL